MSRGYFPRVSSPYPKKLTTWVTKTKAAKEILIPMIE